MVVLQTEINWNQFNKKFIFGHIYIFLSAFYIEIILDSHVRNTEIPRAIYPVPPVVAHAKAITQYHNQGIDID